MTDESITFGKLLSKYRKRAEAPLFNKNLTQESLGELVGAEKYRDWVVNLRTYSQGEVSRWENKEKFLPSRDLVIVIIDILLNCKGISSLHEANMLLHLAQYKELEINEIAIISEEWEKQKRHQTLTDKLELDAKIWEEYNKSPELLYKDWLLVSTIRVQIEHANITSLAQEFLIASIEASHKQRERVRLSLETALAVKWVSSSLIGWLLPAVLFLQFEQLSEMSKAISMGGLIGLIVGYLQYSFVLRNETLLAFWWIPICSIGWGIGFSSLTLVPNALEIVKPSSVSFEAEAFSFLGIWGIIGLIIGTGQWILLRNISKRATWWIPMNSVAWLLGWTIAIVIGFSSEEVFGAIAGMVSETILATSLVWLLRKRVSYFQPD